MEMNPMNRREFMRRTAVIAAGTAVAGAVMHGAEAAAAYPPLLKAVQLGNLPDADTYAERFRIAKEVGFDGIEMGPMDDLAEAERLGEAARAAGTPVHSIIYGGWGAPMSDPTPRVVERGKKEIENALRTAKAAGADTILLVPAVVTEKVRYGEAWETSQKNIREMVPLAEELGVVIAVENVWNKFLLSPLEFARYVDEFESPWVQAYFDIGNHVIFGFPQDWIRTLGKRIRRLHVKDFKRDGFQWCKLPYEGDVNWAEVRKALAEFDYTGWATEEFPKGDIEYLRELSRRMTLFSEGAEKA